MNSEKPKQMRMRAEAWLCHPVAPRIDMGEIRTAIAQRDFVRLRKPAEYLLWLIAIVAFGYCSAQYSAAAIHQSRQSARLDALRADAHEGGANAEVEKVSTGDANSATLLGRIEIPRVGVSAIVEEGENNATLAQSVGHLSGTALPGQAGNVALAAHRDTYFRDLEDIQPGDDVYFTTATAIYRYKVDDLSVVAPDDVSVIAPSNDSRCSPATRFTTSAPHRSASSCPRTSFPIPRNNTSHSHGKWMTQRAEARYDAASRPLRAFARAPESGTHRKF
jgi:LPXTG-site transpeptidase (sortase) family protein